MRTADNENLVFSLNEIDVMITRYVDSLSTIGTTDCHWIDTDEGRKMITKLAATKIAQMVTDYIADILKIAMISSRGAGHRNTISAQDLILAADLINQDVEPHLPESPMQILPDLTSSESESDSPQPSPN